MPFNVLHTERSGVIHKLDALNFVKISDFTMEDYLIYRDYIVHSDLAYSLLYAWEPEFSYRIGFVCNNPVIVGLNLRNELFFSVIPYKSDSFFETVGKVADMLFELCDDFRMSYIPADFAMRLAEQGYAPSFSIDYSDYIYDINDFVNISGRRNSSKRHEYYRIVQGFSDHRYEEVRPERYDEIKKIFELWCYGHSCEKCIWGCEKKACLRLLDLIAAHPENFSVGVVYLDGALSSFGIAERINRDCVCYHIQKNSVSVNGLTYYLHYNMAKSHPDVPYINWGEDMGIDGLRFNKQKYHPCRMEHKYEIAFHRS